MLALSSLAYTLERLTISKPITSSISLLKEPSRTRFLELVVPFPNLTDGLIRLG